MNRKIVEVKMLMLADAAHQMIYLMEFVDQFRRSADAAVIERPLNYFSGKTVAVQIAESSMAGNGTTASDVAVRVEEEAIDALLAATVESLCLEVNLAVPVWVKAVPPCRYPYFVSGVESIKAITLVESPVSFRRRNVFVLKNFLSRA
ncbi:MAG: hypothetical protein IAF08_13460 [Rhizobacter sp.]|nr:hypothetical protein [Chlorobiales bacterium]